MKHAALALIVIACLGTSSEARRACTGSSPTWYASADSASVNACIASASSGDTINVAAGTADWSAGGVEITKTLTIIGAGTGCPSSCDNATTLQVGSAVAFDASADNWRVSGFTFEGAGASVGSILINAGSTNESTGWRVDHCHFKDTTERGISVGAYADVGTYGRDFPGVIDHNRFSATVRFKAVEIYGGSTYGASGEWATALALGGASFVFIEDNVFVFSTMPAGVSMIDGDTGARVVIRHNTITNGDITGHGLEGATEISGASVWRSIHGWEIYDNSFTFNVANGNGLDVWMRGGTGVIYNNAFAGTRNGAISYQYDRGDGYPNCSQTGACSGSSAFDGNETGKSGYACYMQIGMTGTAGITSMPAYQWANTQGGVVADTTLSGIAYDAGCGYQHVQFDRDVYRLGAASQDVYANLPGTCTVGAGYWATDRSKLYKCTATNTWTEYYSAYTYPYPGVGPRPVSNVIVKQPEA